MKDFKEQYYILNVPWKRKLDIDSIQRFDDFSYDNIIVFDFDFIQSMFKANTSKNTYNKNMYISAINVCLRYYQIIKTLYPHNQVRIIIHINKSKVYKQYYDTFKPILDIIPNFAVCNDPVFMDKLDNERYKHIIYGDCNRFKPKNSDEQRWSVFDGKLNIKYKRRK